MDGMDKFSPSVISSCQIKENGEKVLLRPQLAGVCVYYYDTCYKMHLILK
jgi:hypothetical protein